MLKMVTNDDWDCDNIINENCENVSNDNNDDDDEHAIILVFFVPV